MLWKKPRKMKRRSIVSLLLAGLLTLGPVLETVPQALADEGGSFENPGFAFDLPGYDTVTMYEWHRLYTQNPYNGGDLPYYKDQRFPVLVMWEGGGNTYFANGTWSNRWHEFYGTKWDLESGYFPKVFGADSEVKDSLTFYTTKTPSTWKIGYLNEKEGKNKNIKEYAFWPEPGVWIHGEDDFNFDYRGETEGRFGYADYAIPTKDNGSKFQKNLSTKYNVYLYTEEGGGGDDCGWVKHSDFDDRCKGYNDDNDCYYEFAIYYGLEKKFSAITDNIVLHEGQVLNIEDGVILWDGKRIIIEPGAVLTIKGQFYNNGIIENHGTVVLCEDACVNSFMPDDKAAGKIICDGGLISKADCTKGILEIKLANKAALETERDKCLEAVAEAKPKLEKLQKEYKTWQTEHQDDYLNAVTAVNEYEEKRNPLTQAVKDAKDALEGDEENEEKKKTLGDAQAALLEFETDYKAKTDTYLTFLANISEQETIIQTNEARLLELYGDGVKGSASYNSALIGKAEADCEATAEIVKKLEADGTKFRGEGNLIIKKGARLFFDNTKDESLLDIRSGGSVVCDGMICSPQSIFVADGKVVVKQNGVINLGYRPTRNLMGLRWMDITSDGKFAGMDLSGYNAVINMYFESTIENQGRIRCGGNGHQGMIYDPPGSVNVKPYYGDGIATVGNK